MKHGNADTWRRGDEETRNEIENNKGTRINSENEYNDSTNSNSTSNNSNNSNKRTSGCTGLPGWCHAPPNSHSDASYPDLISP